LTVNGEATENYFYEIFEGLLLLYVEIDFRVK